MAKALIIVDLQNDFCLGGTLEVANANDIFPSINRLKNLSFFDQVYLTQDWHPEKHISFAETHGLKPFDKKTILGQEYILWPVHCVAGQKGAQISELLQVHETDQIIYKGTHMSEQAYSGFGTHKNPTELAKLLFNANVKEVYIAGLAFDFCVGATAFDAIQHGFTTYVISDATKSVSSITEQQMHAKLIRSGVNFISESSLR